MHSNPLAVARNRRRFTVYVHVVVTSVIVPT